MMKGNVSYIQCCTVYCHRFMHMVYFSALQSNLSNRTKRQEQTREGSDGCSTFTASCGSCLLHHPQTTNYIRARSADIQGCNPHTKKRNKAKKRSLLNAVRRHLKWLFPDHVIPIETSTVQDTILLIIMQGELDGYRPAASNDYFHYSLIC